MIRNVILVCGLSGFLACSLSSDLVKEGIYKVDADSHFTNIKITEENGGLAVSGSINTSGRVTSHISEKLTVSALSPNGRTGEVKTLCVHADKEPKVPRQLLKQDFAPMDFKLIMKKSPEGTVFSFKTELEDENCKRFADEVLH